jgi:putative hydroxymethylpyrimidine transport system substrate-binding protein
MRRTLAAAGLLFAALALSACGAKTDQVNPIASRAQPISLELDWLPNADHVGLYEAQANGDFRRAGLKVDLHVPTDPASPLSLLESGKVNVAISYEPQLMLARNQGATILAFAALTQRPLTSIISVGKKHITSPADLRGKTVGTAGIPYQKAYLDTILQHSHVPVSSVKQVNVGSDLVPAMISGRVDATLGGYWNYEAIQLRQADQKPNVIRVSQAGVPNYDELVLVTTETFFANHTNELRRLVQAIGRGYEAVRSNPAAGIKALDDANPSLNPKLQTAAVKATLPAFFPAGGKPFGWQVQSEWNAYGRWMTDHHLIAGPQAWAAASTNQLLAGQGP